MDLIARLLGGDGTLVGQLAFPPLHTAIKRAAVVGEHEADTPGSPVGALAEQLDAEHGQTVFPLHGEIDIRPSRQIGMANAAIRSQHNGLPGAHRFVFSEGLPGGPIQAGLRYGRAGKLDGLHHGGRDLPLLKDSAGELHLLAGQACEGDRQDLIAPEMQHCRHLVVRGLGRPVPCQEQIVRRIKFHGFPRPEELESRQNPFIFRDDSATQRGLARTQQVHFCKVRHFRQLVRSGEDEGAFPLQVPSQRCRRKCRFHSGFSLFYIR